MMKDDIRKLHDSLIIIDGHCDTILALKGTGYTHPVRTIRNFKEETPWCHLDQPRLERSGMTCQVMALYAPDDMVDQVEDFTRNMSNAIDQLYDENTLRALNVSDIKKAKKEGKLTLMKSIEGGLAIGSSLDNLREFYDRGIRMVGLTYNRINALGRGCGTKGSSGLTPFGRDVVGEMAKLGMIVDVSHLSDEGLDDLVEITELPLVASHSNSRFIHPHMRNLTDRQLESIAETGGLVSLTYAGSLVHNEPKKVTFERLMEHLDHMLSVVGPDHIGLGSDFDGFTEPYGVCMKSCLDIPKITEYLASKGWTNNQIAMIMGGNWLRVMETILG